MVVAKHEGECSQSIFIVIVESECNEFGCLTVQRVLYDGNNAVCRIYKTLCKATGQEFRVPHQNPILCWIFADRVKGSGIHPDGEVLLGYNRSWGYT